MHTFYKRIKITVYKGHTSLNQDMSAELKKKTTRYQMAKEGKPM